MRFCALLKNRVILGPPEVPETWNFLSAALIIFPARTRKNPDFSFCMINSGVQVQNFHKPELFPVSAICAVGASKGRRPVPRIQKAAAAALWILVWSGGVGGRSEPPKKILIFEGLKRAIWGYRRHSGGLWFSISKGHPNWKIYIQREDQYRYIKMLKPAAGENFFLRYSKLRISSSLTNKPVSIQVWV